MNEQALLIFIIKLMFYNLSKQVNWRYQHGRNLWIYKGINEGTE